MHVLRINSFFNETVRHLVLVSICLIITILTSCTKSKIPEEIRLSFEEQYLGVEAEWEEMEHQRWKANFLLENEMWEAIYDISGLCIEKSKLLTTENVPVEIKKYADIFYPTLTKKFSLLIKDERELYLIEIINDNATQYVYFDKNAWLVKDENNTAFNNLREDYLTATFVKWEKEGHALIASFYVDDKAYKCFFDEKGKIIFSQSYCTLYETPSRIVQSIKRMANFELESITKRVADSMEVFLVTGNINDNKKEFYFDTLGNLIEEQLDKIFNIPR